ncbi:MAG: TonB-dependent receptor [Rhodothermaceae bacterium]|nr:TonB-dependent receptor [Rhodothermaceae bacterium]MYE62239.1 TonB-dependent receptor [Rhodothermaceae bacterium]MYJ21140.1 TonB-dependent receptor [Rhodothermaceae bacterium]
MRRVKNLWTWLLPFACIGPVHAQHVVHGHVADALTGTAIESASVIVLSSGIGTTTDGDGHFELTLPLGDYELRVSFVGYTPAEIIVSAGSLLQDHLKISLLPMVIAVDEVVVQSSAPRINDPATASHHLKATEDLLDRVPGTDFVQRANFAWEPVIRGLSGGQVGLVIDGIKVVGACVDKMDPSSSYVEVENLKKLELTKGGFDLTQSSQIGGNINLITQKPRFDQPLYADAEMNYSSAAKLRQGRVSGGISRNNTSVRGSFSYKEAGDFSPGGRGPIRSSGFKKNNYKLDLSQRIGHQHEFTASFLGDNAWDVGYPVLLMDAALAKAKIYSLTHTWNPRLDLISGWETKLYTNRVDHWMSDFGRNVRERSVMRAMHMPMFGKTRTTGGVSTLKLAHGVHQLEVTLDAYQTKSFGDMWMFSVFENIPDMYLLNLGDVQVRHGAIALDLMSSLRPGLTARIGVRLDHSPREVLREEAVAILKGRWGVRTLAQSYTLVGASFSLTKAIGSENLLRLSLANVGRLPTHVENYGHYVYNYVDGYFYTGNPKLKPERSMQAELGFERWTSSLALRASVFGNYIRHYIVGENDGDLLGNTTLRFRTYQNASAAFLFGGEVSAVVDFREWFEWTASISYTRGQNLELDEPMYLIPPLTGWSSLRVIRDRTSSELEVRMAMPQNRVARKLTGEDGTDGYFVVNIRGSVQLLSSTELSAGVNNVFDVYYHKHLSYGNLPSLGRDIYLTLSYSL